MPNLLKCNLISDVTFNVKGEDKVNKLCSIKGYNQEKAKIYFDIFKKESIILISDLDIYFNKIMKTLILLKSNPYNIDILDLENTNYIPENYENENLIKFFIHFQKNDDGNNSKIMKLDYPFYYEYLNDFFINLGFEFKLSNKIIFRNFPLRVLNIIENKYRKLQNQNIEYYYDLESENVLFEENNYKIICNDSYIIKLNIKVGENIILSMKLFKETFEVSISLIDKNKVRLIFEKMDDFLKNCFNPVYKLLICCKGFCELEFYFKKDRNTFKIDIIKDDKDKEKYVICLEDSNGKKNEYHTDLKKLSKFNFNELLSIISNENTK